MRGSLLFLPLLLMPFTVGAVTPAKPERCRIGTPQSADLSEADRIFLNEQGGGLLWLCWYGSSSQPVAQFFSGLQQLPSGLCRYSTGILKMNGEASAGRWSVSTTNGSQSNYRYLPSGNTACPPTGYTPTSWANLLDSPYIQVTQTEDELFIAFMQHWQEMSASRDAFMTRLAPDLAQAVTERKNESWWLAANCLAASAKGCKIKIKRIEVSPYTTPLVRVGVQLWGLTNIDDLNTGRPDSSRYMFIEHKTLNFWRTTTGFDAAK